MLSSLKNILKEAFMPDLSAKEITPEFLQEKRMQLIVTEKYVKWLKKRIMLFELAERQREMRGIKKDRSLEETIKLLKEELSKEEPEHYSS